MNRYYLIANSKQEGPFTVEELQTRHLIPSTPIWYSGATAWLTAGEIPELRALIDRDQRPQSAPVLSANSRSRFRLRARLRAIAQAVKVEVTSVTTLLAINRNQRICQQSADSCGETAISEKVEFGDQEAARLCREGQVLLHAIQVKTAEENECRTQISSKSGQQPPTGNVYELRGRLAQVQSDLKQKRIAYSVIQRQLGTQVLESDEINDRFAQYLAHWRESSNAIRLARESLANLGQQRLELNKAIGLGFRKLVAGCILACALLAWLLWPWLVARNVNQRASSAIAANAVDKTGLKQEQLALSSQYLELHWTTWRPGEKTLFSWTPAPNVDSGCRASCGVVSCTDTQMVLATNRHVLMLPDIAQTRTTDLALLTYEMTVTFPTGKSRKVRQIGYVTNNLDLAFLFVDRGDLKPGIDFVTLPLVTSQTCVVGDDVVAVGNPVADGIALEGTQTFGHISAFRDAGSQGELAGRWIQTDTAINHGNSGGPLLVKKNGHYFWIGINSDALGRNEGGEGLNLALDASQVFESQYVCKEATPEGTTEALHELGLIPTSGN